MGVYKSKYIYRGVCVCMSHKHKHVHEKNVPFKGYKNQWQRTSHIEPSIQNESVDCGSAKVLSIEKGKKKKKKKKKKFKEAAPSFQGLSNQIFLSVKTFRSLRKTNRVLSVLTKAVI